MWSMGWLFGKVILCIAMAAGFPTVSCRDRSKKSMRSAVASYPALSEDCIFLPASPQEAWTNENGAFSRTH